MAEGETPMKIDGCPDDAADHGSDASTPSLNLEGSLTTEDAQ
jgi:hypothetical protein